MVVVIILFRKFLWNLVGFRITTWNWHNPFNIVVFSKIGKYLCVATRALISKAVVDVYVVWYLCVCVSQCEAFVASCTTSSMSVQFQVPKSVCFSSFKLKCQCTVFESIVTICRLLRHNICLIKFTFETHNDSTHRPSCVPLWNVSGFQPTTQCTFKNPLPSFAYTRINVYTHEWSNFFKT